MKYLIFMILGGDGAVVAGCQTDLGEIVAPPIGGRNLADLFWVEDSDDLSIAQTN